MQGVCLTLSTLRRLLNLSTSWLSTVERELICPFSSVCRCMTINPHFKLTSDKCEMSIAGVTLVHTYLWSIPTCRATTLTSNSTGTAFSRSSFSGILLRMLSASSYTISSLVFPPPLLASLGCTSRTVVIRACVSWVWEKSQNKGRRPRVNQLYECCFDNYYYAYNYWQVSCTHICFQLVSKF